MNAQIPVAPVLLKLVGQTKNLEQEEHFQQLIRPPRRNRISRTCYKPALKTMQREKTVR